MKIVIRASLIIGLGIYLWLWMLPLQAQPWVRGIYISQPTLENTPYLKYLIKRSKANKINTFVIDLKYMTKRYRKNIALVKANNLKYVTRIVVFPYGGKHWQVKSVKYWQRKYRLIEQATTLGAQEIQLDYIRYHAGQRASKQNARNINRVIQWFKARLRQQKIPLQIAVFGVASHGEARHIGQNLRLFANHVDAMCPMLYPSHYEPYRYHSRRPYKTVRGSLAALRKQFNNNVPFKVYTYIETSNYRYPLSRTQKMKYIYKQIKAVEDGKADGWYAWSPNNKYDNLFRVLRSYQVK